jgi:hypothetical protein
MKTESTPTIINMGRSYTTHIQELQARGPDHQLVKFMATDGHIYAEHEVLRLYSQCYSEMSQLIADTTWDLKTFCLDGGHVTVALVRAYLQFLYPRGFINLEDITKANVNVGELMMFAQAIQTDQGVIEGMASTMLEVWGSRIKVPVDGLLDNFQVYLDTTYHFNVTSNNTSHFQAYKKTRLSDRVAVSLQGTTNNLLLPSSDEVGDILAPDVYASIRFNTLKQFEAVRKAVCVALEKYMYALALAGAKPLLGQAIAFCRQNSGRVGSSLEFLLNGVRASEVYSERVSRELMGINRSYKAPGIDSLHSYAVRYTFE